MPLNLTEICYVLKTRHLKPRNESKTKANAYLLLVVSCWCPPAGVLV
jgi:hypothetical protein